MSNYPDRRTPPPHRSVLKACPWCAGALVFDPRYPVMRLFPGESRLRDHDLPPELRTVQAWVCRTPLCKFREKA